METRTSRGWVVVLGALVGVAASGACSVEGLPACPGQCFEYTLELGAPQECQDGEGDGFAIAFTGHDPVGYHGRHCFNAASVPQVVAAIEHLRGGGALSDLSAEVVGAYVSTVEAVRDDLRAQCITAAPGQCTNADAVCTGIAADAYELLVVDQTCVLEIGGVAPVELGPGQTCHAVLHGDATGSGETADACTAATTGGIDGADTTGGGADGADTTAGSDGADETSGGMMLGPFGEIEARVRCDGAGRCTVERALLSDVLADLAVLQREQVTLTLVDGEAACGPGARIAGLDPREHGTQLAEALGVRNGDVIAEIAGTTIEELGDAMEAVAALLREPSTTIVVGRPEGAGCKTIVREVRVR